MAPRRIGLFGGAFDPPHRTHVALAQAAIAQLQLERLHVVPTGQAWHKARALSAAEHRLAMCRLAFAGLPQVLLDARELDRDGPSYTIDTLHALQAEYPGAQLYLVLGGDQARALASWHRAGELERAAIICVALRDAPDAPAGAAQDACGPSGRPLLPLQLPPSPLNATEVRARRARGQSIDALVTDSVARYIDQHHLYQAD